MHKNHRTYDVSKKFFQSGQIKLFKKSYLIMNCPPELSRKNIFFEKNCRTTTKYHEWTINGEHCREKGSNGSGRFASENEME
jgi:hypothetical protein